MQTQPDAISYGALADVYGCFRNELKLPKRGRDASKAKGPRCNVLHRPEASNVQRRRDSAMNLNYELVPRCKPSDNIGVAAR